MPAFRSDEDTAETPALNVSKSPDATASRRRAAGGGGLLLLVVAAVTAAWNGVFDAIPLLNSTAAASCEVGGAAALVTAWCWRQRGWTHRVLPLLLFGATGTVGLVAFLLWATGTVNDAYPPSFAVWVGTAFAAFGGCPLVLRQTGSGATAAWRKTAAVCAVPLTLLGGFMLIDQEYGIWPHVGDVLNHTGAINDQKALHDLTAGTRNSATGQPGQGVIADLDAPSTQSHFSHRPGVVFLPPAYFGPTRASLSVLVMLVGSPGTPINWLKSGHGQSIDDAYAAGHHGVAPVLVVVDQNGSATGDTECVDGPQGNAETYLTVDVPAFITGTLHLAHDPARWGVVGFSEGGTCALDLVLGHPDVYRHLVDLGGDAKPNLGNPHNTLTALYGGSLSAEQAHDPSRLLAEHQYPGVTAWFAAGAADVRGITVGQHLATETAKAGIPTHQFIGIGGHNWQFASDALTRVFAPLCDELATTSTRQPTPGTRYDTGATTTGAQTEPLVAEEGGHPLTPRRPRP